MDMHPRPKGLDAVDLRIVAALLEDGRISNRDLARLTGVAEPTCSQRRRRLERMGVIVGYAAIINFEKLPSTFCVWFSVRLACISAESADEFERMLGSEIAVASYFSTGGEADYFFEAQTTDYQAARALKHRLEKRRDVVADIQMFPIFKQSNLRRARIFLIENSPRE